MIHLALILIALVVIVTFISGTLSVIGAAFEAHPLLGILSIFGCAVFWIVVLAFVL